MKEHFWKHNSNKYLVKRQFLTRQMILCITVSESLHNASKQDKPLCYRQCEPFFHLATANIHWTRAQRVCLWGQPCKKKCTSRCLLHYNTQNYTFNLSHRNTAYAQHTRMAELMCPDVWLLNLKLLSARRPFELPLRKMTETQWDFFAPFVLCH